MSSAEFRITSDLAPLRSFVIQGNFDECRAWLNEELEPYRTMAVTEDSMPQAKKYRAAIRRVRDHIDECRKVAKKEALAVYEPFEARCRELTALCDSAAQSIDSQVKAFEETAKAEKERALHAYFDEHVGEMSEYLTWEYAFTSRWLNATFGADKAQAEIDSAIEKCTGEVESIRALHSEFEPSLLLEYRQTHNLGACLRRHAELKETKQREEKRRAELEAAKKEAAGQAAPRPDTAAAPREEEPHRTDTPRAADAGSTEEQERIIILDFRIYATQEQLSALRAFLSGNGIRYSRVPKD